MKEENKTTNPSRHQRGYMFCLVPNKYPSTMQTITWFREIVVVHTAICKQPKFQGLRKYESINVKNYQIGIQSAMQVKCFLHYM